MLKEGVDRLQMSFCPNIAAHIVAKRAENLQSLTNRTLVDNPAEITKSVKTWHRCADFGIFMNFLVDPIAPKDIYLDHAVCKKCIFNLLSFYCCDYRVCHQSIAVSPPFLDQSLHFRSLGRQACQSK